MARATRATTTKRKRVERTDEHDDEHGDAPPTKLPRHDDNTPARISAEHAAAVLAILETADTQGLLDRVRDSDGDSSLRTLLAGPQPLSVLRAAVQHLVPISALPRANPSSTATAQLRFCNLAKSLLNQATHPVPLSLDSILPLKPSSDAARPLRYALVQHLPTQDYWSSLSATDAVKILPTAHAELVAILPTPAPHPTDVPTLAAYAPTRPLPSVAALPRPTHRILTTATFLDYGNFASFAPSADHNGETVPPRELARALYASHQRKQRRIAARRELREGSGSIHEVLADSSKEPPFDATRESSARESPTNETPIDMAQETPIDTAQETPIDAAQETPIDSAQETPIDPALSTSNSNSNQDLYTDLQDLLPPSEIAGLKSALANLELENAVQELLDRNRAALVRLEELQIARLFKAKEGEGSAAEEGSEEWDTAQGIMDSLAVLASLRPRTSSSQSLSPFPSSTPTSILPPPHILHKLHRTLALEPTRGWYGTLPSSGTSTALRDDTTVRKSSRSAPVPTPAPVPVPVPTPQQQQQVPTTTAPVYTGYGAYAYGAQQQQAQTQYRPATTTTTNGTAQTQQQPYQYTPQYYNYTAPTQQVGAAGVGAGQQNYYAQTTGQQQQGYASAAYSGWYNAAYAQQAQAQQTQVQAQPQSGTGTPQPVQMQMQPTTYGSFFGNTAGAGAAGRTPAVANTVAYTPRGLGQLAFGGGGGGGQQQGYYAQAAAAYQQGQGGR
ncbi:hypothetical protein DXG03_004499 [Asterophora parasitica]|uniref:Uncharacterized protein n=1 Tax=Asterophora parasitica TaxID=117018 RepID=A0A9P7KBR9_9AGAR|nr:hypothetical protein DXG03_004499 [Asterophora parasitica]